MNRLLPVLSVAAAALLSLAAPLANAAIFIGLQQDAGAIVTVASGPTPVVPLNVAMPFGNFEGVSVSGLGQPGNPLPNLLNATSIQVNNDDLGTPTSGDAGTLTIYVTSTDNTAPLDLVSFTSGFAAINLTPGWTETLETYLDPGNGVPAGIGLPGGPGLTTLLGSAFFNTVAGNTDITVANAGGGPYSVTAVFRITAPVEGSGSSQIGIRGIAVVPEPGSLALLGAALAGFGIVARRRRRVA